jgi:hypothetical protein
MLTGTQVHVRVKCAGAALLGIDDDASKLIAFTDDRGTDLSQKDQWLWPFLHTSDDGQETTVTLKSEKTPGPGARELRLRAVVALKTGADPQLAETKDCAFAAGSTLDAGFATWTVKESKRENGGLSLTLHATTSFDGVRELVFVGPKGALKHDERGTCGWSINGKGEYTKSLFVPGAPEKMTMRVAYWGRTETAQVPIDVAAGVGF